MRKLMLLFAIISCSLAADAQDAVQAPPTNAGKFASRTGVLVEKEYTVIGILRKTELSVVNYRDLVSDEKISAIEISADLILDEVTTTKIAVIDADELDGFIKALKTLNSTVLPSRRENYTEVTYRSRGGFEAGCIFTNGEWNAYMMLEKKDGASVVFIERNDFVTLLLFLEDAKKKMLK